MQSYVNPRISIIAVVVLYNDDAGIRTGRVGVDFMTC